MRGYNVEDFFRHKNILVTGGAGFIGSNLVPRLVSLNVNTTVIDCLLPDTGANLTHLQSLIDSKKIHWIQGDLTSPQALQKIPSNPDIIFNLAGKISHQDSMIYPVQDMEVNSLAHLMLLEWCRTQTKKPKIIFTSTRQIYGKPKYLPVDEKHSITPVDINGIHKYAAEEYHRLYNNVYQIPSVILRLTNTFGPRQPISSAKHGVIAWFINRVLNEQPITLFDGGYQLRDINYVEDVVDALLLAAQNENTNGKVFNLAGSHLSLRTLAEKMISVYGKGQIEEIKFPEDRKTIDLCGDYYGSSELFEKTTGWSVRKDMKAIELQLVQTLHYFLRTAPSASARSKESLISRPALFEISNKTVLDSTTNVFS